METLSVVVIAIALFGLAALVARARRRSRLVDPDANLKPEEYLLDEAKVVAPIAPGMAGKVEVRKLGLVSDLCARAEDPAQAFERGARVRLIDYRDGTYLVEPADEEHLVH